MQEKEEGLDSLGMKHDTKRYNSLDSKTLANHLSVLQLCKTDRIGAWVSDNYSAWDELY